MSDQDLVVKRMCAEIEMDMRAKRVPRSVKSFGDLHSYVDANEYGGFCEDAVADSLIEKFGGRDADEGLPQGFIDLMNACQTAVSLRLRNGYFR